MMDTLYERHRHKFFKDAYLSFRRMRTKEIVAKEFTIEDLLNIGFEPTGISSEKGEIYAREEDRIVFDSENGFINEQYKIDENGNIHDERFI